MRNKELFDKKLERLESVVKLVGYHIHKDDRDLAYKHVDKCIDMIAEMQTLLSTETQD